jgi:Domain of unknown function (DUF1918)
VKAQIGDAIVVESERAMQTGRRGVIEEILQETPLRCRVKWNDGRESIFVPQAGSTRIEAKKKPRAKAKAGAR